MSKVEIIILILLLLFPTEGKGELSQFVKEKSIQLVLDIAEWEKWPVHYLYTNSWMVADALWELLQHWKQNNWQHRDKPIWTTALQKDIAEWVENMVVKICHEDAHVPKGCAIEEYQNNQQLDKAARIEVDQVDLNWQNNYI